MDGNVPFQLPVFNGYTVDKRLRQFRKIGRDMGIEFIEFDSNKGLQLLMEMEEYFSFLFE